MAQLVRALNSTGIERFRAYLARLRSGAPSDPPWELLEEAAYTTELTVEVMVERREFASRLDVGKYLCEVLGALPPEDTDRNKGLWAWMSLFFFDQVCPAGKDGIRRPGQDYRHVPDFSYRYRHRHLLYGPYQVYRRHGTDSVLLLSGPPYSESTIYHEIASRQDLIANKGVVGAALILYFDPNRAAPKQGSQEKQVRPGTIRRFVRVLQQLDVTYDIYGMSNKQILELLPREFDPWRTQK
jgi:hypothetical protein